MIDVLINLQSSSNIVTNIVDQLVLEDQPQRTGALFLSLLSAAAQFSGSGQHTLCRKVLTSIIKPTVSRLIIAFVHLNSISKDKYELQTGLNFLLIFALTTAAFRHFV